MKGDWIEAWDDEGNVYYTNQVTRERREDKFEGMRVVGEGAAKATAGPSMTVEMAKTLVITLLKGGANAHRGKNKVCVTCPSPASPPSFPRHRPSPAPALCSLLARNLVINSSAHPHQTGR